MPTFAPEDLPERDTYFLLTSLVVPRPIAWVSTLSPGGVRNLAPHSYFNVISSHPPIVHFTSTGTKDTLTNVRAHGEFVVNVVTRDLIEEMNVTAADFPPEEDEFAWAGLASVPSEVVTPPRVLRARASLECTVRAMLTMGTGTMVFGDVRRIHVDDSVWAGGRVDPEALDAVGRLAGSGYLLSDGYRRLPRPTWQELARTAPSSVGSSSPPGRPEDLLTQDLRSAAPDRSGSGSGG